MESVYHENRKLIPHFSQIPDVILDFWMARLTGAEFKIVMYVARRTYGFRRDSDAISLHQMASGLVTRAGERLDMGTGLNRDTIAKTVQALIEKHILIRTRMEDERGGDLPSVYSLDLTTTFGEEGAGQKNVTGVGKSDSHMRRTKGKEKQPIPVSDFPTPSPAKSDSPQSDLTPSPVSDFVAPLGSDFPTHNIEWDIQRERQETTDSTAVTGNVTVAKIDVVVPADADVLKNADSSKRLITQLVSHGVRERTAEGLVHDFPAERIEEQLRALPYRNARNEAAVIVDAIKRNLPLPAGLVHAQSDHGTASRPIRVAAPPALSRPESTPVPDALKEPWAAALVTLAEAGSMNAPTFNTHIKFSTRPVLVREVGSGCTHITLEADSAFTTDHLRKIRPALDDQSYADIVAQALMAALVRPGQPYRVELQQNPHTLSGEKK